MDMTHPTITPILQGLDGCFVQINKVIDNITIEINERIVKVAEPTIMTVCIFFFLKSVC